MQLADSITTIAALLIWVWAERRDSKRSEKRFDALAAKVLDIELNDDDGS